MRNTPVMTRGPGGLLAALLSRARRVEPHAVDLLLQLLEDGSGHLVRLVLDPGTTGGTGRQTTLVTDATARVVHSHLAFPYSVLERAFDLDLGGVVPEVPEDGA